ncbi:M12 family metallo-peptidase [Arenimonas alkanexedens]
MRNVLLPSLSLAIALAIIPSSPPLAATDGKGGARLFKLGERVEYDGLLRMRPLSFDTKSLERASAPGARLLLPDAEGGELEFEYLSHTDHGNGIVTWHGRRPGDSPGFEAVLTFGGNAVFGQAPRADGSLLHFETVGGQPRLMEDLAVDEGQRSNLQVDDMVFPDTAELLAAQKAYVPQPGASTQANPNQVDILLAYTPGLAAYIGGDLETRVLLQNRIALGNQSLANAGIAANFRLVATPRIDYPDTGSNSDTLDRMRTWNGPNAHPIGPQLNTLRHRHGADLVGLVRRFLDEESGSCGVGYVNGGNNRASSIPFAQNTGYFNANHGSDGGFFCLATTIAHEIGHNLGQAHDIETSNNNRTGAHTYAHGYRVTPAGQNGFSTVMAYGTGRQRAANVYSTPLASIPECDNLPCGLVDADAARSLTETIPMVAAWMKPADEDARQIVSNRGYLDIPFSGLPALTNARWVISSASVAGNFRVTGPTRAAPGANLVARLAWDGLQAPAVTTFTVQVQVQSSPGIVVATRQMQLSLRDIMPAPLVLGDNAPVTMAVPAWGSSRDFNESRLHFVLPPHANTARVRVVSTADIDLYATPAAPRAIATQSLIGAGLNRNAVAVSDTGSATTKEIVITRSLGAVGAERWTIGLGRASSGSLNYANATVSARIDTQSAAPAFQSGQYYNPLRPGHGIFLDFAGNQWISVWYTYLDDGTPTWYYSQAAAPGPSGVWNAPIFRIGWNGSNGTETQIGNLVVTPVSVNEMEFSYNIDGEAGSEPMARLGGSTGCPVLAGQPLDATGHWYSPSLPGFGYSAQFEVDQEVYTSYMYDGQGIARWLIGNKTWPEAGASLPIGQLTGFCPTCGVMPVVPVAVGQLTRSFGVNQDGRRGLTQIGVTATFVPPLTGSWNESRATDLLALRKNCL